MSILLTESFSNPNSPLWASGNALTALVGTPQNIGTEYYFYPDTTETVYSVNASKFSVAGGSYVATLCFNVSIPDNPLPMTGNIPLVFLMELYNSIGSFLAGVQYNFDCTEGFASTGDVCIAMPFVSDGSPTTLEIAVTNVSSSAVGVVLTTTAESVLFLGVASQTGVIFNPS